MLLFVVCLLSFFFGLIFLTLTKVPREISRVPAGVNGINGETVLTSPVRKERLKRSKKEIAAEAAKVLSQADKVGCIANEKGTNPDKFYTLPNRKRDKEPQKEYASNSLGRRSNKRRGSLELQPPKKPPRTFTTISSSPKSTKPSIFDIFKKPEKNTPQQPKKSNLRRSVSDASSLKSKAFGPVDTNPRVRKRADSDSEENGKKINSKKQLSPIIEVAQREDYFASDNKENIKTPEVSPPKDEKHSESVTDQLKNYIEEVDEALYKETGIRITTPPPKKDPRPIIIDLDKAENISSHKKHRLNFAIGKKLKSLTHKKPKSNEINRKNEIKDVPRANNGKATSKNSPAYPLNNRKENTSPVFVASTIQSAIQELQNLEGNSPVMIHSSQKPVDKPLLTKGKAVNSMVKRLSSDSCSSPPPTRTNVLIMPNVSVQHNNNMPFSYTRGISPDKYRSNEDLPREMPNITKPVIYAQVVCGAKGLNNEKQTIHTTYHGRRQPPQSDSDEGLGGEDSLGFNKKYEAEKSFTRFGDEQFDSYQSETEKLLDEIDKYKAESPILPKYRSPSQLKNAYPTYNGIMERGRADGMDAKRRESLTEPENGALAPDNSFGSMGFHGRGDLSARRDLLESRINRRISDKTTPSPEYPNKTHRNNVYISEQSSKYYRSGSTSPVGYKEKYVSETKTDAFGERHVESRTKKFFGEPNDSPSATGPKYNDRLDNEPKSLDYQISDYRSSPENHRFESSQNTNSRNRYRTTEKPKLLKDKNIYRSTPEIHNGTHPSSRNQHSSYHDSLPREVQSGESQRFRSERFLNREESDRRTDRFVDSGIENDCRRDSSEHYQPTRPMRVRRDIHNESEDEGFASSLLITNEKQHTESNHSRKSRKDYDSDVTSRDEFYKNSRHKYIPRERSIDDGSHFDPRLDKDFVRGIEKKPPKPEKKSGLEKVKSLFTREKKKDKTNTLQKVKSRPLHARQIIEDERISSKNGPSPDYRNRRRLSTPSPSRNMPKKSESTHGSWFKSLDRLTRRKPEKRVKDGNITSTEDESTVIPTKLSSSTSNLRFFGDTDQESNGDSVRGTRPSKKRPGLRSQSTRDLHKISEENRKISTTGRKNIAHHKSLSNISETERDIKGSRTNLKPPMSPMTSRYIHDLGHREDRRRRIKRPDISSVESSTEGDSSQQSQRSIVYLHAATVGDIPGPGYLRSGTRAASREDLTSNGSSFIQPQVKTLSRSFSVLAPWRPRHQREGLDIDYTQYNKSPKNGKYEQKSSRNVSNRNDNSTLKRKAQESRRSNYQQSLNRQSRSKENLSGLKQPKEELSRGSTSTLFKKKEKLPRENSRYIKDKEDRKITTKSQSVESIARRSRNDGRDVGRSVSMPRDTEKSAGWFKKTKKPNNHRL